MTGTPCWHCQGSSPTGEITFGNSAELQITDLMLIQQNKYY